MPGLLRVVSNADLMAQEQQAAQDAAAAQQPQIQQLAAHIRKCWDENRRAKDPIQRQMIESLRQREGQYDPVKLQQIRDQGGSEIFMMLTAVKCRAASSWIKDVLIQAGDRPWTLEPAQVPDLSAAMKQTVLHRAIMEVQTGAVQPDVFEEFAQWLQDQVQNQLKDLSEEIAEKMAGHIQDQFDAGGFNDALEQVIEDIVTFKAGFLKGPVVRRRKKLTWGPNYQPIVNDELVEEWERVSPFDMYPSPDSAHINDGNLIERIKLTNADLNAMIGVPGYNADNIRAVLGQYAVGGLREWLATDQTRATLEQRPLEIMSAPSTIEALQYWGSVAGQLLLDWGMTAKNNPDGSMEAIDPTQSYEIEAWLIGHYVIRAVINDNPLGGRPYSKASYENIPGSFWGKGIPELITDIQAMCNAAARALSNNLGIASGPMVEVHADRLAPGETVTTLYPWKIFQTQSAKTGTSQAPAVNFYQPDCNVQELQQVFDYFSRQADIVSGIPAYAYGDSAVGGAGNTASGMSMLMTNASKGIKAVISHIDRGLLETAVSRQYLRNMLYGTDVSIKGDLNAVARGSSSLIQKEQAVIRRTEFLQMTANPIDMQIMGIDGRAEILREQVKSLDLPPDRIVPSRDELMMHHMAPPGMAPGAAAPPPGAPGQPPAAGPMPPQAGPQGPGPMPPTLKRARGGFVSSRMLQPGGQPMGGTDHRLFN